MKLISLLLLSSALVQDTASQSPLVYQNYDSNHRLVGVVLLDGTIIASNGYTSKDVVRQMVQQMTQAQRDAGYQCNMQQLEVLKQWKAHNDSTNIQLQKAIKRIQGASK
jgi:hypothetical protein